MNEYKLQFLEFSFLFLRALRYSEQVKKSEKIKIMLHKLLSSLQQLELELKLKQELELELLKQTIRNFSPQNG